MELSASQMRRYGLLGMSWYDEEQLFSGRYATLDDYRRAIESSQDNHLRSIDVEDERRYC
jgi:hypothetical protein